MEQGIVFQIALNGLVISSLYAMIAVGLTLVFGVLRVLNFAHGELLMVGSLVLWFLWIQGHVPFAVALLAAIFAVGGLGIAIDRFLFKRMRANPFGGLLIALGLVYIIQVGALKVIGTMPVTFPSILTGLVEVGGMSLSLDRLVMIPVSAGVMSLVWILLEKTRLGRAVRACTQDSEAASLHGISTNRMSFLVMGIGCGLAGLAGGLITQWLPLSPYMGTSIILKAFVIVIVGGMGSVGGTIAGAFIFGYLESIVSTLLNARFSVLFGIILMFCVLVIRPRGLFGRE